MALTNFVPSGNRQPGKPWVILHEEKLYVSYDCDSVDAATGKDLLRWQAFVKVYELAQGSTSVNKDIVAPAQPSEFSLEQNFPNPFNSETDIQYTIPKITRVKLSVCDLLGREVSVLKDGMETYGTHTVRFDASRLAGGVYLVSIETGDHVLSRRLTLMKWQEQ